MVVQKVALLWPVDLDVLLFLRLRTNISTSSVVTKINGSQTIELGVILSVTRTCGRCDL